MARGIKRHRQLLAMLGVATLIVGAAFVVPSQAQTGGNPDPDRETFELDGNANDSGTYDGEDWSDVYDGTSSASATVFESEMGRSASIFTGGGSKDPNFIADWRWKDGGGLPDKDNLLHAFAARYGDLIVFGSDRYDNSGDAMQGFWFLQELISMNPDGTFSGEHRPGDLLILSDFSIGGTVSSIAVYKWVDSGGDVATHLDLLFDSTSANCLKPNGTTTDGDICGIVNGTMSANGNEVPWPFKDKSGSDSYLQGEFFEGGIDLSQFPDFAGTCFAGFAAETRSSTSPTATLKDFVVGGFESCSAGIDTTPSKAQINLGETIYDHAVVSGSGVTGAPVPTGTVSFSVCSPDELTNGLCKSGGTSLGSASLAPLGSTPNPSDAYADSATYTPDEVGTWCFRGDYSGDSNYGPVSDYDSSECFTVVDYPSTTSTAQSWTPNDSATVTAPGAPAWSGKVSFYLRSGSCSGNILYKEENIAVSSSTPTVSTSNNTYKVTASGDYWWEVKFTSSTNGVRDSSHCERTQMTITN